MNVNLRKKIKEKFNSQIAFAKAIGEHDSLVSKVLREWRDIPAERKEIWAKALDCEVEDL